MTDRELASAIEAIAREAGAAIMEIYALDFAVETKSDDSPVTEADQAADAIIVAALRALTPQPRPRKGFELHRIGDDYATTTVHGNLNRIPLARWKFKNTKGLKIAVRSVFVKRTWGLSLVDAKGFATVIMVDGHESFGGTICVLRNCNTHLIPTSIRKSHGIKGFATLGTREEVFSADVICNAAGLRPRAADFCIWVIDNNPR